MGVIILSNRSKAPSTRPKRVELLVLGPSLASTRGSLPDRLFEDVRVFFDRFTFEVRVLMTHC